MTIGETWAEYMGVPDEYPEFMEFALEAGDAMWDAALDVLRDRTAADPVLRTMMDDRYQLWELVSTEAGKVPIGTRIHFRDKGSMFDGTVRKGDQWEQQTHPSWVHVSWDKEKDSNGRYIWTPQLRCDSAVQAWLPVPLDVSALVALVTAESGAAAAMTPPHPRRRRR